MIYKKVIKQYLTKFFYMYRLKKSGEIDVQQIRSNDNLANLFTKVLPTTTFNKFIHQINIRQLKDLNTEPLKIA